MNLHTSHASGKNPIILLYELVYHNFVSITYTSYAQEGLCYFALKSYFVMLRYVIHIHRTAKFLTFNNTKNLYLK